MSTLTLSFNLPEEYQVGLVPRPVEPLVILRKVLVNISLQRKYCCYELLVLAAASELDGYVGWGTMRLHLRIEGRVEDESPREQLLAEACRQGKWQIIEGFEPLK